MEERLQSSATSTPSFPLSHSQREELAELERETGERERPSGKATTLFPLSHPQPINRSSHLQQRLSSSSFTVDVASLPELATSGRQLGHEDAASLGRESEEEREQPSSTKSPLFPLSHHQPVSTSHHRKWLSNSSFTVDVASLPEIATSDYELGHEDGEKLSPEKPYYGILDSPASESSKGLREMKKRKRKKRKRNREVEEDYSGKSRVRVLSGSGSKLKKDYYFDTRGDRDNLAFGSLYKMDIARYRLHHLLEDYSGSSFQLSYFGRGKNSAFESEGDVDALDGKLKTEGRYYCTKYMTLERHKDLKHVRVLALEKLPLVPGDFIPLIVSKATYDENDNGLTEKAGVEESWEDEVIRKTKEFNKMSRDFPHDEKVWMAFADFQDKIASTQSKKGARLQVLEKKISILEKAMELNPDNEDLLICLMKAYQSRDSTAVLVERWERTLVQHSDSCKLWKEFIHFCLGDFSRFKVSYLRKIYSHAVRALSSAFGRLCGQIDDMAKTGSVASELTQLETGLVDIFVSLCRFEWQTGHQELATGLFQALIEYNLFCPSLLLTENSKQRLFEHFWNGDGARVGEDGALGWSAWLETEEENRQKAIATEVSFQDTEKGGWTGWSEPLSRVSENSGMNQYTEENNAIDEGNVEEDMPENIDEEDEMASLMEKLGMGINADADVEIKDTTVWMKWSEEETARCSGQWMPVREKSDNNDEAQLSREVLFEDVSDYLFSLSSEESRYYLLSHFIDFFGGPISQWSCSNSPCGIEKLLSLEGLPESLLSELHKFQVAVDEKGSSFMGINSDCSLNEISGRPDHLKFLRNAILLCIKVFPRNYVMEEALLNTEGLLETRTTSDTSIIANSRTLAKSLLKKDRQDLLLCGVYARREASSGNIDVARKIFDMALSSIKGLSSDLQSSVPLLYLWYAEMELAHSYAGDGYNSLSQQRAIHILSCLGSGIEYIAFKCEVSNVQLLRARQGYKQQLKNLRSVWARGDIKESSTALVCSAALFERLTSGWTAAHRIYEEALSMALPGRRSQNLQLESLFVHFTSMYQKNLKLSNFSKSWEIMLQGLQLYPYNPKIFAAMMEVARLYTVPNKIRRILDQYIHEKPSITVYLFALAYEMGKSSSHHRIHGLFERALANDELHRSVFLWRFYLEYEIHVSCNLVAARRVFFRAIHACPWSKKLWLEGFLRLNSILSAKELSDLQDVMREKELLLRTDIYEILLQDEITM